MSESSQSNTPHFDKLSDEAAKRAIIMEASQRYADELRKPILERRKPPVFDSSAEAPLPHPSTCSSREVWLDLCKEKLARESSELHDDLIRTHGTRASRIAPEHFMRSTTQVQR